MDDSEENGVATVASHSIQAGTMSPKAEDSTWIHDYRDKQWPVVLCGESTDSPVLDKFLSTRPQGHVHPAILLGKHIFIWVADERLLEYDPNHDYLQDCTPFENENILATDDEETRLEKARCKAFRTDAPHFQSAAYWHHYIERKSEAREAQRVLERKNYKKHKSSQNDDNDTRSGKSKSQKRKNLRDDDDFEVISSKSSSTTRTDPSEKRYRINHDKRRERSNHIPTADVNRRKYLPTPDATPLKSKVQGFTTVKVEELDSEDSSDLFVRDSQSRRSPSDESCKVFVGDEKQPFVIPISVLNEKNNRDYLADRVYWNDELGSHIFLEHPNIKPRSYRPIHEFLVTGDFAPRMRGTSMMRSRLEGVVMPEEIDDAACRIATVYSKASILQLADLQQLCVDKLKVLRSISALARLQVAVAIYGAESYGCDAEQDADQWLIELVAEQYWTMTRTEGRNLERVMTELPALRQKVMIHLARHRTSEDD